MSFKIEVFVLPGQTSECRTFHTYTAIVLLFTCQVCSFATMCTREKKMSRNCGIKVLNHAMTGVEGTDNCQKFVDILGLRTVFPLFMKTPKHGRAGPPPEEIEGA